MYKLVFTSILCECACLCVHLCVYMPVYMRACMCIYGHVNVCKFIFVGEKLICVSVRVFARKNAWIYMCVHVT